ncbi:hypothetical protein [Actinacidiphila oryziradicis]|nr:hypothetical protein [Actinacidiphila oryziradicis]
MRDTAREEAVQARRSGVRVVRGKQVGVKYDQVKARSVAEES